MQRAREQKPVSQAAKTRATGVVSGGRELSFPKTDSHAVSPLPVLKYTSQSVCKDCCRPLPGEAQGGTKQRPEAQGDF